MRSGRGGSRGHDARAKLPWGSPLPHLPFERPQPDGWNQVPVTTSPLGQEEHMWPQAPGPGSGTRALNFLGPQTRSPNPAQWCVLLCGSSLDNMSNISLPRWSYLWKGNSEISNILGMIVTIKWDKIKISAKLNVVWLWYVSTSCF